MGNAQYAAALLSRLFVSSCLSRNLSSVVEHNQVTFEILNTREFDGRGAGEQYPNHLYAIRIPALRNATPTQFQIYQVPREAPQTHNNVRVSGYAVYLSNHHRLYVFICLIFIL
jgi:hypothetical protein